MEVEKNSLTGPALRPIVGLLPKQWDFLFISHIAKVVFSGSGRGFIDEWIAINLKNKPNDNETRFAITDRIEAYTASIRRK